MQNFCACIYQAIFARKPFGQLRTQYFRASSRSSRPAPNAYCCKLFSTGTVVVKFKFCRDGMYRKMKATAMAKIMAGKRERFCGVC